MADPKRKPARAVPQSAQRFGLADMMCFSVYATGHAFNRVYKPLLDPLGLTYPQLLVMQALWDQDDQTVGGLGEKLFLESSTLTPLLKRLEQAGLVTRRRDADDERQVRIRLTAQGEGLRGKAQDLLPCIMEATGLSVAELRRLQGDVMKLRRALVDYDRRRGES